MGLSSRNIKINFIMFEFTYLISIYRNNSLYYMQNFSVTKLLLNCDVGETLESPLDCKEIQPVHSKGDQFCVFTGRTDAKAETPVLWPPHVKSWLIGKDPDAGKDWRQEEKGTTEDEMVGWHHWLDGNGFGWTPGVCDRQGGLACYSPWGCKESDISERLNWTDGSKCHDLTFLNIEF